MQCGYAVLGADGTTPTAPVPWYQSLLDAAVKVWTTPTTIYQPLPAQQSSSSSWVAPVAIGGALILGLSLVMKKRR